MLQMPLVLSQRPGLQASAVPVVQQQWVVAPGLQRLCGATDASDCQHIGFKALGI
jgi:hypothetical protein